jgi:hypothetical protein
MVYNQSCGSNNILLKNNETMTNINTACISCNTNQKQDLDSLRDISCNTYLQEKNASCNTNQKQDLDILKDMSCNTLCHERNISTMTNAINKPMRDSTSCTSYEFGTMTKKTNPKNITKEISSEAKDEHEIGVMTNSKIKNNIKNTQSVTVKFDADMGINCNMNEFVTKHDSTCDAKQFENHVGSNTSKKQEVEFSCNAKVCDSEMGINCNMNEFINKKDSTCDAKQFEQQVGINTNINQVKSTEFSTITNSINKELDDYF